MNRRKYPRPEDNSTYQPKSGTRKGELVSVRNLKKSFGSSQVLHDVSFSVLEGEVLALLGRNGAGKTTTMDIVAGISKPSAGEIVRGAKALPAQIGYAAQEIAVYTPLTVYENLKFFASLAPKRARVDALSQAHTIAEVLRLTPLFDRPCYALSGGERRRLHVAIALFRDPRLVILDEPTAGVDVETRRDILSLVTRMAGEGRAIIYSTHYFSELESLPCRIIVIDEGRIVLESDSHALHETYGGTYVEAWFGESAPSDLAHDGWVLDGRRAAIATNDVVSSITAALSAGHAHGGRVEDFRVTPSSIEALLELAQSTGAEGCPE
jgi:ABC-2 type transport system ATP-binding protein